jgi:hypothetical protein
VVRRFIVTDEQKIEKLAKWRGWKYTYIPADKSLGDAEAHAVLRRHHWTHWNPLTNIADAWMLVEHAKQIGLIWSCPDIFNMTAVEAAKTIATGIMEGVESNEMY